MNGTETIIDFVRYPNALALANFMTKYSLTKTAQMQIAVVGSGPRIRKAELIRQNGEWETTYFIRLTLTNL